MTGTPVPAAAVPRVAAAASNGRLSARHRGPAASAGAGAALARRSLACRSPRPGLPAPPGSPATCFRKAAAPRAAAARLRGEPSAPVARPHPAAEQGDPATPRRAGGPAGAAKGATAMACSRIAPAPAGYRPGPCGSRRPPDRARSRPASWRSRPRPAARHGGRGSAAGAGSASAAPRSCRPARAAAPAAGCSAPRWLCGCGRSLPQSPPQTAPLFGEAERIGAAAHQRNAEVRLQLPQPAAHRRLCDAQPRGSGGQAAGVCDHMERPQALQRQRVPHAASIGWSWGRAMNFRAFPAAARRCRDSNSARRRPFREQAERQPRNCLDAPPYRPVPVACAAPRAAAPLPGTGAMDAGPSGALGDLLHGRRELRHRRPHDRRGHGRPARPDRRGGEPGRCRRHAGQRGGRRGPPRMATPSCWAAAAAS